MADQDWMRHDHRPQPKPAPTYPETLIWTLTKDGRIAEMCIRHLPHGRRELRCTVGGQFIWSEAERDGVDLQALSADKRQDFEARGWR